MIQFSFRTLPVIFIPVIVGYDHVPETFFEPMKSDKYFKV